MTSYAHDVYPSTPTFTFSRASYKSQYLVFKSVEEYTNYLNSAGTNYQLLQSPTKAEVALVEKYDTPKYVTASLRLTAIRFHSSPWTTSSSSRVRVTPQTR